MRCWPRCGRQASLSQPRCSGRRVVFAGTSGMVDSFGCSLMFRLSILATPRGKDDCCIPVQCHEGLLFQVFYHITKPHVLLNLFGSIRRHNEGCQGTVLLLCVVVFDAGFGCQNCYLRM